MKIGITELFIFVDDFCKTVDVWLKKRLLADKVYRKPTRTLELGLLRLWQLSYSISTISM
ncbi:hypothetical protein MIDIC_130006 [Alphaproteobacteria bacterium]